MVEPGCSHSDRQRFDIEGPGVEGGQPFLKCTHEAFVDKGAGGCKKEVMLKRIGLTVSLINGNVAVEATDFVGVPIAVIEACDLL